MKYFLVLLLTISFSACAMTQESAPVMPQFTSSEGKECARTCQTIYAQCNQSCSIMVGGARTASQREKCFDNCNQTLGECYSTCE